MDVEILDIIDARANNRIKFSFGCGKPLIDEYINKKEKAWHETIISESKTNVLILENKVIGFYTVKIEDFNYQDEDYKCIYIKYIAIDKKYQGRGLGKQVLDLIMAQSEETISFLGLMGVMLKSVPTAKRFYGKNGFKYIKTVEYDLKQMIVDFRRREYFEYIADEEY